MKIDLFTKIIAVLVLLIILLLVFRYCFKKPETIIIEEEVIVIDSVAVQTLNAEIKELKNKLDAKPKVVIVTKTIHDTLSVTDTLTVYPIGSNNERRDYTFKAAAGDDSLSLKVNTDLYSYVYTDDDNKFYYEDSLRVWLTDINIYTNTIIPPVKNRSAFYLMGGVGAHKYEQSISMQTITQTDIQPNLGIGYMRGIFGGYLLGSPNGANIGVTVNMTELFRGILYQ